MSDKYPDRALLRIDYDGTHDGTWTNPDLPFITRIRDALGPECNKLMIDELPDYIRQIAEKASDAPKVKPLVWDGLRSGSYIIELNDDGTADLFCNDSRDEHGYREQIKGGYLTLISIDDLKDAAQSHHERRIREALE